MFHSTQTYHALSLKILDKALISKQNSHTNTSCKYHAQAHTADVACNIEASTPVATLQ